MIDAPKGLDAVFQGGDPFDSDPLSGADRFHLTLDREFKDDLGQAEAGRQSLSKRPRGTLEEV